MFWPRSTAARASKACAAALLVLLLVACGGRAATPAPPATATNAGGLPHFDHVFLVVMENLDFRGAMAEPTIAQMARTYASATNYDAVAHPSLPNYLALASGSTWGVTSDCTACYQNQPNLATQLAAAGTTWGAYMEGLSSACDLEATAGEYAGKHDPFRYFTDVRSSKALCGHIQPLTALNLTQAPAFAWISPNLCHDGHDCAPAQAGAWLDGFVAQVVASPSWKDGGVLFVTWDEGIDNAGGGGQVLTLVIAPGLPAGEQVDAPYTHYSLLHTIEAGLGLPPLGQAAEAPTMAAFWH